MNKDVLERAKWAQNKPHIHTLKCLLRDGGAVLATVRMANWRYFLWSLGESEIPDGSATSLRAAQRDARNALQEALQEPGDADPVSE